MQADKKATYNQRTETIKTGSGHFIRVRDLFKAVSQLNEVHLDRLIRKVGMRDAVQDPYSVHRKEVVHDIVDLCRSLPQYTLPIVHAASELHGVGHHFDALIRDERFGGSSQDFSAHARRADPIVDEKITAYFFKSKGIKGEFQYFIRQDRQSAVLPPGQAFDDMQPYADCFLVMRTDASHYFLRWPTDHPEEPAFWIDGNDQAVPFWHEDEEDVDWAELYPGYTYEVFGVQFQLPDLGVGYGDYHVDHGLDAEEEEQHQDWDWWDQEQAADGAPASSASRREQLLETLEAIGLPITTERELSRHFRQLSVKYHPLKHLQASEAEKEAIRQRYTDMTNAYNELKAYYPK